jgi:hypothetical protein
MTWLEHCNDGDLALLASTACEMNVRPEALRHDDRSVEALLAHPAAFDAILGERSTSEVLPHVTPFLTFAVMVHRGWRDLGHAAYVEEWTGPRQRLPVLGGADLADFLASSSRRLFLTELLASFTHVVSGIAWIPTRRGLRKQRFSELDPVRLASLLDVVPDRERPGVYRRLGDVALFLTGVFPDHTETHELGPVAEARLLRAGGLRVATPRSDGLPEPGTSGPVGLLERLGASWYHLATALVSAPLTGTMTVVADVADRFAEARRILNFLTDRYLLPYRSHWFGESAT